MYQALYRKWRPKTFSEVVGQEHITETLRHQVAQQRTAHAYLFTGTRGTGKTTCARILAKAINCAHPVNGEPCNTCDACRGIDEGTLLDVTELDAASNNGVDHVRALREEAIYTPAVLKKRVYIIDEVHMLTREAFNALLKILEEPPEHLVFILATTELHKVPATILSRCQRFSFKRILPEDIRRQLLQIAQAESIPLTDDGAGILARMAGGALRDALSLLDQCRGSSETLDAAAVLDALGLAGSIQTAELMTLVLQRDTAGALALFDRLYRSGKDVSALLGELLDLCRDLTITKAAPEGADALLTGVYDRSTLQQLGKGQSLTRCLYLTETLQHTCSALADSFHLRTEAELCLLRLCDESLSGDLTALVQRMDRLEEQVQSGVIAAPQPNRQSPPAQKPAAVQKAAPAHQAAPQQEEPPLPEEPPLLEEPGRERVFDVPEEFQKLPVSQPPVAQPSVSQSSASGGDGAVWGRLLDQYKGRLPVNHRVFLNMATGTLEGDCLTVWCNNDFVRTSLDNPTVTGVLQEVTAAHLGGPVRVVLKTGNAPAQTGGGAKASPVRKTPPPQQPVQSAPAAEQAPEQRPPWEEPAQPADRLDELVRQGEKLSGFEIK